MSSRDRRDGPPEDTRGRVMRQFFEKLDARFQQDPPPAAPEAPRPTRPPASKAPVTRQSPALPPVAAGDVPPPSAPPLMAPEIAAPTPRVSRRTEPLPQMSAEAWERQGALPFRPASPGQPPPGRAVKTRQCRVAGLDPGGTTPPGNDSIERARAVLPFPRRPAFPRLTLEQYVSLCVDVALWPTHAIETRRRYGVPDEAAGRALDAHWQEKLSRSAELCAERDAAVATYTGWRRRASG
jgi:hypothetical protein